MVTKEARVILHEKNLSRIAYNEGLRDRCYVYACIVDMAEPFKVEDKEHFAIKLKIIDPSFNFKIQEDYKTIKFQRYAYLYIYAKTVTDLPTIENVGEVIRLRRFKFIENVYGELIGIEVSFSNWLLYSLMDNDQEPLDYKSIQSNETWAMNSHEENKLKEIRQWGRNFFKENSLMHIVWWNKLVEPNDENKAKEDRVQRNNVDLILKCVDTNQKKKIMKLVDINDKLFFIKIANFTTKVGEIIRLRNVDVEFKRNQEVNGRVVLLNVGSSCLKFKKQFFDAKLFDPEFKALNFKKIIQLKSPLKMFRKSQNFAVRKDVLEMFPILEDYYFEEHLIGKKELVVNTPLNAIASSQSSMVKKDYDQRIPHNLEVLSGFNIHEKQNFLHQKVVTSVYIKNIKQDEISTIKYCRKCLKSQELNKDSNYECCKQLMNICLVMNFKVQDEFLSKQTLNFYVIAKTDDLNPFMLWNILPNMMDYKSWSNLTDDDLQKFWMKLNRLKFDSEKVKMVVEMMKTKSGKFFYQICDTLFLP